MHKQVVVMVRVRIIITQTATIALEPFRMRMTKKMLHTHSAWTLR